MSRGIVTFRWRSALLSLGWNSSPEYLVWEKHVQVWDIRQICICYHMFLDFKLKMQEYSVHVDIHLFLFK